MRQAHVRLTLSIAWRHFADRKPHLVEKDLAELAAMPGMAEGDRAAAPGPALDYAREDRTSGPPWPLAVAITLPALLWLVYLMLTRQTPGSHGAALDWIALLMTLAAGAALYGNGSHGRRPSAAALMLYVFSQALWLIVAGLLIAHRLEMH